MHNFEVDPLIAVGIFTFVVALLGLYLDSGSRRPRKPKTRHTGL
jgi:hypothetical protein